eukprot:scaffold4.g4914.t1
MCCCYSHSRFRADVDRRVEALEAAAEAAARRAPAAPGGRTPVRGLDRDSARTLLEPVPEEEEEAGGPLAAQRLEEAPACVREFLARAVRDGRRFRLFTLTQVGKVRLSPGGGWREAHATLRACPLEPAFVWRATAALALFVTLQGCDSLVGGAGASGWQLWRAAPAGGSRELDQAMLVRWLADAACYPQALLPSRYLGWEAVKGSPLEALAVLRYRGVCVRCTFRFDRFGRVQSMRSMDAARRLPGGGLERGELEMQYSGHMLFGLSAQGPVLTQEVVTQGGVYVPTSLEASWRAAAGGGAWPCASFTVARVVAA